MMSGNVRESGEREQAFARTLFARMGSLFPFVCSLIVLVIGLQDDVRQRPRILVRDGQLMFEG